MAGESERVLYVGQSGNLRARLGSYKNARPDRAPRKVIRLIHCVKSIAWEECETAQAARIRENELLRVLRPRFNRMNTYPRAYNFFWLKANARRIMLGRCSQLEPNAEVFGAFKTRALAAYAALIRLLWQTENAALSTMNFPIQILGSRPPRRYSLTLPDDNWQVLVRQYLSGISDDLIGSIQHSIPGLDTIEPVLRTILTEDLEILTTFYESGPKRNREFCVDRGLDHGIVPQECLDDLSS